jgi:hypothetical protein
MDTFITALVMYTRQLSADVNEKDEASCKRFFAAVAPIDEFRSTVHTGDAAEPATPAATAATPAAHEAAVEPVGGVTKGGVPHA